MTLTTPEPEVSRLFWRNFLAHTIEGGLYMGGIQFVVPVVVLTYLVEKMQGPALLTGLVPILMYVGFMTPPLFMAHRIERLSRMKPLIMITGIFQRLPYLLAALALIFWVDKAPRPVVWLVALTPLVSGLAGGVTSTAWMNLVAKTIPGQRLCTVWAVRLVIRDMLGICAGMIVFSLLKSYPGPEGYGYLHLIAFGFLVLSYLIFALIRETHNSVPEPETHISLKENLKLVPGLLRVDSRLRNYCLSRIFFNALFIAIPFLSRHALTSLDLHAGFLGLLVGFQSTGAMIGNVIGGYIGDRWKAWYLLIGARVVFMALCVWTIWAAALWEFCGIFFLLGFAMSVNWVGNPTFRLSIAPEAKRHTYLGLMSFIPIPSMVVAGILSSIFWKHTGSIGWAGGIAAGCMVASLFFMLKIREGAAGS